MIEKDRFGRPIRREGPKGTPRPLRIARAVGTFLIAFTFLWLVLASPLSKQTEMSWAVPFGLLPISLLLGVGGIAQEYADIGTELRRDGLFGLSSAVASLALLRSAGVL
jgi:hypothetical protein